MSATHVNAFYMNVDEKKKAVEQAKAELAEAKRLLKAHPDFEEPKEDEPQVESKEDSKPEAKETKTKTAK